jgi:hypothetical protein
MGKAAKEHKAKIAKRNERLKFEKKQMEKKYRQDMEKKIMEFQNKFSGLTESDELIAENVIDLLSNEEEVTTIEDNVTEIEK